MIEINGSKEDIKDFLGTIKYCQYNDINCDKIGKCGEVCGLYNVQINYTDDRKEYKEK